MEIKSIDIVDIPDGEYNALHSAYIIVVQLPDGTESDSIKVDVGVKCINCKCRVKIEDGWLLVID